MEHRSMKALTTAAGGFTTSALLAIGVTVGGFGSAAAQPTDYSTLPIHPNDVTDSMAYSAAAPVSNPNGQPGITTVYTHRDGTRQITNTILVLSDAPAATAAMNASQSDNANRVANGKTQPAAVGTGGTIVSGTSPDGSKTVNVLTFTEGNTATTVEFDGPTNDPAPTDLIVDFGQKQDTAIKGWLTA
jgi:hypothetical protein